MHSVKRVAARVEDVGQKLLTRIGLGQPEHRIIADAQTYWSTPTAKRWLGNSHWRDSDAFEDADLWHRMGAEHVAMFDRGVRAAGANLTLDRIVDWGCGGGGNAVAFMPRCRELIGVDISQASLDECERQLAGHRGVFTPVRIDIADPEKAVPAIGVESVDAFVSYYVLELVPTPAYGLRLMGVAHQLLAPGGVAHVQIKYATSRLSTRPRGRNYLRGQAQATSYEVPEFWEAMQRIGFRPVMVELVPRNELDERYAYFTLVKDPT
ncbi:class I SAM-dependent methyltransferase [Amycolatopsis sp. NPDC006131]|uniref:class I SAM-dependent methyltransferase n=1 Tax=Amycolatopsis sp. NPDC006131 TaxID=3156731 RepID=UPI0033BDB3C6